jgi:DNA-binding CsgD family transcriptional regulator
MSDLELFRLTKAMDRLGDAVIDPAVWPELMEGISSAVGATGAALLQSDNRTPDVPMTTSVEDYFQNYFENNLHIDDIRAVRGVPLLLKGEPVVIDQDIFTSEQDMLRDPLYAHATSFGMRWWAVVGFNAGDALWGLAFQRAIPEGMFTSDDKKVLANFSQRLTEVATLSTAVGRIALASAVNAMEYLQQAAIAIDRFGNVLDANASAQRAFDDEFYIRQQHIVVTDKVAGARFETLFDRLRTARDTDPIEFAPIVIHRTLAKPLIVRLMPVHPAAKSPFLGARALLVFSPLAARKPIQPDVLIQAFALTGAEARLAVELAEGTSLDGIAQKFGTTRETIRNQLKMVFLKTGTHRQAELVSLLNQFKY